MPPRLHDDEVTITDAMVRALVDDQHPQWAHLPLRRFASGGTVNAVYRLGDALAVRLPLNEDAVGSLLKEIRWVPTLAPHLTLDVPTFAATGVPGHGYPLPWAVVHWLDGRDAHEDPPLSMTETAATIARFIGELSAIPLGHAPAQGTDGFERGGPLTDRAAAVEELLPQCVGLLTPAELAAIEQVWRDALAAPAWCGPPVWLHADLLAPNLLVRDGRVAGVLDFGTMSVGDPAYDLRAGYDLLDAQARREFRDAVGGDEATWRRARGLVVSGGVIALPYYRDTNPTMVTVARRGIREVLAEVG